MIRLTCTAIAILVAAPSLAEEMALPDLAPQASAQAVVDEHVDALNKCDWNRLMAQYPEEVAILLPAGTSVTGRKGVGDLFAGFCKDHADGGLNGLTFTALSSVVVGDTLNVQWQANADFLAEPYLGADAYVTKDGLMYAQVTTFDGAALKMK